MYAHKENVSLGVPPLLYACVIGLALVQNRRVQNLVVLSTWLHPLHPEQEALAVLDAGDAELLREQLVVEEVAHRAVDAVTLEGGGVLAEAEPRKTSPLCRRRRVSSASSPFASSG